MRNLAIVFLIIMYFFSVLDGQNAISLEKIRLNATFQHISCHIDISGDVNQNSTLLLSYKALTSAEYLPGAETMRATPDMIVDGSALGANFHAGSVMFLAPDESYDIRMEVVDPDGGSVIVNQVVRTKKYPSIPFGLDTITVLNSNGPDAIQSAIDQANEGSVLLIENGVYNPFTLTKDSLFLKSLQLHGAVIDGSGTDRGVVTIGTFDDSIRHVLIDGFEIRNGRWGIDAQNTQFLTLQNCYIRDVGFGILNRRERGWDHDQYITNNLFEGRTSWPQSDGNIPAERAIDIRGNNNVVSYNTIKNFGDGITTDGPPRRSNYSLDVHHNDVSRMVDDLIEVDGIISNARVYNNRAYNGRAGVSLAPVYGGPVYIFRNEFANMENSTYKMNRQPAGLYIVHNTTLQEGDGMSSNAGWQNTVMKNNIVLSGFYCFQEYGLVSGSMDDWDYNGYFSARSGTSGGPWFKWDNIRYANTMDLANGTSIEANAVELALMDLENAVLPTDPFTEVTIGSVDLSLSENSSAKDAGLHLPNINKLYVSDGSPDLGFKEMDAPSIKYGHDFQNICNDSPATNLVWTGAVSNAWNDRRNWAPCGLPTKETIVVIPDGLSRYPIIPVGIEIKDLIIGNE